MREELTAFFLTFVASSAFISIPYILLAFKGIPIAERVPAQRIVLELGIVNTAFMLSRALGSWKAYAGTTKLGTSLLVLGVALMLVPSFPALVVGRALQGFGSGMTFPALEVRASKRGVKGMVRLNVAQNLGFSVGSLFAGEVLGFPREPLLLALPFAAAAVAVSPPTRAAKVRQRSSKALRMLYATAFLNGVSLGSRGPALSAYVLQYVSAMPASFSVVWGVPGVVAMFLSLTLARALDKLSTEKKLYASSLFKLAQSIAIASIIFVRDLWVLVALLALSRLGSVLSVATSKAAQGSISRRVEHFGARQTAFSLGNAVGPMIGAALYKAVGPYALLFSAGLGLVSATLYTMSGREIKKSQA